MTDVGHKIEPLKLVRQDYIAFRQANGFHGLENQVRAFLARKQIKQEDASHENSDSTIKTL